MSLVVDASEKKKGTEKEEKLSAVNNDDDCGRNGHSSGDGSNGKPSNTLDNVEKDIDNKTITDTVRELSAVSATTNGDQAGAVKGVEDTTTTKQDDTNNNNNNNNNNAKTKTSKRQVKRQRKWEELKEFKRIRKEQQHQVRIEKAKSEGRNLSKEQQIMEENRILGKGWKRRDEIWQQRFDQNHSKFHICIDCSFENYMSRKEISSLASQIRECYATNKRVKHPVFVTVTHLAGETVRHLQNVSGFPHQWQHRKFNYTSEDFTDVFEDKSKLVYLTSDSSNTLQSLDDDRIYIIGGIVDRNRLKHATINRARQLGIATARLPITECLHLVTTNVLTTNHVFEILVKLKENNNNWKKTLQSVLPERKDAKEK